MDTIWVKGIKTDICLKQNRRLTLRKIQYYRSCNSSLPTAIVILIVVAVVFCLVGGVKQDKSEW